MKHIKFYHTKQITNVNISYLAMPKENVSKSSLKCLPNALVIENLCLFPFKDTYSSKYPHVTVCGIYDDEAKTINFGIARCSSKDVYIKEIGRNLSKERAMTNPILTIKCKNNKKFNRLFIENSKELSLTYLLKKSPIKF